MPLTDLNEIESQLSDDPRQHSLLRRLRNYMVAGLLIAAPLGITWYICTLVFNWIDGLMRDYIRDFLASNYPQYFAWTIDYQLYGIGILGVMLFLIILGAVGRNMLGRQMILLGQQVLLRVPFVGWVYNAAQQISNAVLARKKGLLQRAVLVQFPRAGIWTIAFVTSHANLPAFEKITNASNLLFLFIPTTPNPTSGWLIVVPESETYPLDVTVDEAVKMIISGGVVVPPSAVNEEEGPIDPDKRREEAAEPTGAPPNMVKA